MGQLCDKGYDINLDYSQGRLDHIPLPDGGSVSYQYDDQGRLHAVVFPDNTRETYLYENADHPYLLTAILDANGVRYAEWEYDDQGRAISSQHASGTDRIEITYRRASRAQPANRASVTNAKGHVKTVFFDPDGTRITKVVGGSCSSSDLSSGVTHGVKTYTYGIWDFITDESGTMTRMEYRSNGTLRFINKGYGTDASRETRFNWNDRYKKPTEIHYPGGRTVRYTYGQNGRVEQITVSADNVSRTTNYRYNAQGLLAAVDGPRTDVQDVTTYAYDARRRLVKVVNALGHAIEFLDFDAYGRVTQVQGPNGIITQLAYNARGRLVETNRGGRVTTFTYDATGHLTGITTPTDAELTYSYDTAGRLTAITNEDGHRIRYTLDAAGNRTEIRVSTASGTVARQHRQIFDELGRLIRSIGAQGQTTHHQYDVGGHRTTTTDPAGTTTHRAFDALDRIIRQTDAMGGITTLGYNDHDRITSVTGPNGHTTRYTYNAFGNRIRAVSPDAGTTTYAYNAAGNVITKTNALGQTTTYTHDALGRRTTATYADGTATTYTWDTAPNGIGRLAGIKGSELLKVPKVDKLLRHDHKMELHHAAIAKDRRCGSAFAHHPARQQSAAVFLHRRRPMLLSCESEGRRGPAWVSNSCLRVDDESRPPSADAERH